MRTGVQWAMILMGIWLCLTYGRRVAAVVRSQDRSKFDSTSIFLRGTLRGDSHGSSDV